MQKKKQIKNYAGRTQIQWDKEFDAKLEPVIKSLHGSAASAILYLAELGMKQIRGEK